MGKPVIQMARPMTEYERQHQGRSKMPDELHITAAMVFVAIASFILGVMAGLALATF